MTNHSSPDASVDLGDAELSSAEPSEHPLVLLIAVAALLTATLFAFLFPHANGDTFMTLAGGRDVVQGKLAAPDDWSFASEQRVWINQSWLTGVLFYELWQLLGYAGLLVYKFAALSTIGIFVVLAARQFQASFGVSILVAAFMLGCLGDVVSLRANLLGMTLWSILVWLLARSYRRPYRVWLAVGLITLWAHVHGSFVFGIAVLGLWTVVNLVLPVWREKKFDTGKLLRLWHLPVASAAAIVLAAVTSPFGIRNLTQPFTLMGLFLPEPWPLANQEMLPLFLEHPTIPTYIGLSWYLFSLGCLALPLVLRVWRPTVDIPRLSDLGAERYTKWVFMLILVIITVLMTLRARRFVPVSLIACAPLLAAEFQWLLSHRRYAWLVAIALPIAVAVGFSLQTVLTWVKLPDAPPGAAAPTWAIRWAWSTAALFLAGSPILGFAIADRFPKSSADDTTSRHASPSWISWAQTRQGKTAAVLLIAVTILALVAYPLPSLITYYRADDYLYGSSGMFERMVVIGKFPLAGVRFLELNAIHGNMLNDWTWEGFVHWHHPEVKLMVGGRSRQVYSPRAATAWKTALQTSDPAIYAQLGIQLLMVQSESPQAAELFRSSQSPWHLIYYDGSAVIACSRDDPQMKGLLEKSERGTLEYPSEKTRLFTQAAQNLMFSSAASAEEIIESVAAATRIHPHSQLYDLLLAQQHSERVPLADIVVFFEAELVRLHDDEYHIPAGIEMLRSRQQMAATVANYYEKFAAHTNTRPDLSRISFWRLYAQQCGQAGFALLNRAPPPPISDIPIEFAAIDAPATNPAMPPAPQ